MSKIDELPRPRFSFDITEEQQARAFKLLNLHGMRRAIMSLLLDEVLDLIEEHGHVIVGILIERAARVRDIIPALKEAQIRGSQ
jgi:hypothetical protein